MDARVVVNADELADIYDFEPQTLRSIAAAVAASRRDEDFVYREVEIDEVLRLADFAKRMPRADRNFDNASLDRLRAALIGVWRMVSSDNPDAKQAASALLAIADEFSATANS